MNERYMDENCSRPWKPVNPICPGGFKLARAYVPYQQYVESYPPQEALEKGTMFPELYSPYDGKEKMCK